ncbi:MAG: ETC complex I subunit [Rhodospirillales bacterium]|nr:ETC complex I subunit [Alphaproteobacteria bacterium]MCB9987428.1 ETC complex I subunit [Rhodospirillales bacterium]USO07590.1 MAG: ETC complex I subunit [Rhodospirillales bacterium]
MKVRIYQPARSATQSGRARLGLWVLEYERETKRGPEPLMGWTASGDTLNQVTLEFPTREEAVAYAERKGWEYTAGQPHPRIVTPRNYVDNFKYRPAGKSES